MKCLFPLIILIPTSACAFTFFKTVPVSSLIEIGTIQKHFTVNAYEEQKFGPSPIKVTKGKKSCQSNYHLLKGDEFRKSNYTPPLLRIDNCLNMTSKEKQSLAISLPGQLAFAEEFTPTHVSLNSKDEKSIFLEMKKQKIFDNIPLFEENYEIADLTFYAIFDTPNKALRIFLATADITAPREARAPILIVQHNSTYTVVAYEQNKPQEDDQQQQYKNIYLREHETIHKYYTFNTKDPQMMFSIYHASDDRKAYYTYFIVYADGSINPSRASSPIAQ